jgi:ribosomal protein S30
MRRRDRRPIKEDGAARTALNQSTDCWVLHRNSSAISLKYGKIRPQTPQTKEKRRRRFVNGRRNHEDQKKETADALCIPSLTSQVISTFFFHSFILRSNKFHKKKKRKTGQLWFTQDDTSSSSSVLTRHFFL